MMNLLENGPRFERNTPSVFKAKNDEKNTTKNNWDTLEEWGMKGWAKDENKFKLNLEKEYDRWNSYLRHSWKELKISGKDYKS